MVAASPLIVGDKVLILDETGSACLVAVGPSFEIAGGVIIDETFWSTPAIADCAIFLRGVDQLYCVRNQAN